MLWGTKALAKRNKIEFFCLSLLFSAFTQLLTNIYTIGGVKKLDPDVIKSASARSFVSHFEILGVDEVFSLFLTFFVENVKQSEGDEDRN